MIAFLRNKWAHLSLARQFSLASLLVLVVGMTAVGAYVSQRIKSGVVHETAATTAIYVDSVVAPLTQELAQSPVLSPANIAELDELVKDSSMRREIVSFKIWGPDGRLVYSTTPDNIGKQYSLTEQAQRAWQGEVSSALSDLDHEAHASERSFERLLETYSPVRDTRNGKVIAVAEFYQRVDDLKEELSSAVLHSWMFLGAAFLVMFALLASIVGRGSDTITRQQSDLRQQLVTMQRLLRDNEDLGRRVRRAATAAAATHERVLRQVGAELHDGPLQVLGLASLRLDSGLAKASADRQGHDQPLKGTNAERRMNGAQVMETPGLAGDLERVQNCLQEAVEEIRSISAGLGLPELGAIDLRETVRRAARFHEQRTGSKVSLDLDDLPPDPGLSAKITFYRVVQEALTNAYMHAGGREQKVRALRNGREFGISVEDKGPGFDPKQAMTDVNGHHLGLAGMRDRVESLGGHFEIESGPETGTRVTAWLPQLAEDSDHA